MQITELLNIWARQPDLTGACLRNGESANCGVYFLVTDHIGKSVLMLDANRMVAGAADYDPFGHVNRVENYTALTGYGHNLDQNLVSGVGFQTTADFYLDERARQLYVPNTAAGTVLVIASDPP